MANAVHLMSSTRAREASGNHPHKCRVNGKQKEVRGKPLPTPLVMTRLLDDNGYIVAEWTLLTNFLDT
ncbi:hypothetical protein N8639_02270 [bacterium]|jgi:hypothetical protein|nr:hypothetical protein [bacterium]